VEEEEESVEENPGKVSADVAKRSGEKASNDVVKNYVQSKFK
jgi:hypothetical protein